jgi:hypothetical protein
MNKTDVCPVLMLAALSACSVVTDVDRAKIPDVLFTQPDAGSLDAAASDPTASALPTRAQIAPWGFDLDGIDKSVRPGDDFYAYANGTWLSSSEIPNDRVAWSAFSELSILVDKQIGDLIASLPNDAKEGSPAQKARDFFSAFVDTEALETLGVAPLAAGLAEIAAATTHEDIAALMMRADYGLLSPIGMGVSIDQKDPNRYIVSIGQNGLNLPDREYYLEQDAEYVELRAAYAKHVERMLTLIEVPNAAVVAQDVLALETKIAEKHLPIEETRDVEATYNLRSREEVEALSGFPWAAALSAAGLDKEKEFIVVELAAVTALAAQFSTVPVATWRGYLAYSYVLEHATVLTKAVDDERFDFYGRTLNGQPTPRMRTARGISALNAALSEIVGQLYVQKHFPASYKALGAAGLLAGSLVLIAVTVTIVGIPLALLVGLLGAIGVYAGMCAALTALGRAIFSWLARQSTRFDDQSGPTSPYLHLAVGCALYLLASSLPRVGWLVTLAVVLIGFGALVKTRAAGLLARRGAALVTEADPLPTES